MNKTTHRTVFCIRNSAGEYLHGRAESAHFAPTKRKARFWNSRIDAIAASYCYAGALDVTEHAATAILPALTEGWHRFEDMSAGDAFYAFLRNCRNFCNPRTTGFAALPEWAAEDFVREFVARGGNIDACHASFGTALHCTAWGECETIAAALIRAGANPDIPHPVSKRTFRDLAHDWHSVAVNNALASASASTVPAPARLAA